NVNFPTFPYADVVDTEEDREADARCARSNFLVFLPTPGTMRRAGQWIVPTWPGFRVLSACTEAYLHEPVLSSFGRCAGDRSLPLSHCAGACRAAAADRYRWEV